MIKIEIVSAGILLPPVVRQFLRESAVAYPSEVGSPDLSEWPKKLAAHATTFCTLRADGSLASALFAYLNTETQVGYIPFFCVLPTLDQQQTTSVPQRPKGHAYRLHESYRQTASQLGLSTLRLEVLQSNTHAIDFYKRQGYMIVKNLADRHRYLMELQLNQQSPQKNLQSSTPT